MVYWFQAHLIWAPKLNNPGEKNFVKVTYIFCVLFFFGIPKTCKTLHNTLDTLIEALIALNWFGATWAVALDISTAFDRVKHAGYLMEFLIRYLVFFFFSVIIIDGFKWFWKLSLHKNIQLMLYFLKAPFLVQHLSYYTLIIFLMMLYVILLSMLMILLLF